MLEFNGTFIIAMLSFVVFMMIMNAIFYRPILGIIKKREEYINSNYEDSKRYEADAEEYKTTHAEKIKDTQDKCRKNFKLAIEKTQNEADKKLLSAKDNSKLEVQSKKNDLEECKKTLQANLKTSVVEDLANSIVSKILDKNSKKVAK